MKDSVLLFRLCSYDSTWFELRSMVWNMVSQHKEWRNLSDVVSKSVDNTVSTMISHCCFEKCIKTK
jgi:hypothetical protein